MHSWRFISQMLVICSKLSGSLPDAVGRWDSLRDYKAKQTKMSGHIPDVVMAWRQLYECGLSSSQFSGPMPAATMAWRSLSELHWHANRLQGPIPDGVVASWQVGLVGLSLSDNSFTGAIPEAMGVFKSIQSIDLSDNQLSGSISRGLLALRRLRDLLVDGNQLSGSLGDTTTYMLGASKNKLTGSLPRNLVNICALYVSGNMLEGTIPGRMPPSLECLAIAGLPRKAAALTGHLPSTLRRTTADRSLLLASLNSLEGVIPSFGSLTILSVQNNKLGVMSEMAFHRCTSDTTDEPNRALLHNNLLSCTPPRCGNSTTVISLSGLGNALARPTHGFPNWIVPMDRDMLSWVSPKEGLALLLKFMSASCLAAVVVTFRFHRGGVSRWHASPGRHQELAIPCWQLLTQITRGALWRVIFLMFVSSWNLYSCPPTMALASACLRSDILIHVLVFSMWAFLGFHGSAFRTFASARKDVRAKQKGGGN